MITDHDIRDMDTNGVMWEYYNSPLVSEMVKEFSEVLDQEPNPTLYQHLIFEEFEEFETAFYKEDELKEMADLVYVVYGYANAKGYNLDEALRRVHANNLGRCIQPDGSILRREDGKIIKNKDYPKVMLDDLV